MKHTPKAHVVKLGSEREAWANRAQLARLDGHNGAYHERHTGCYTGRYDSRTLTSNANRQNLARQTSNATVVAYTAG